MKAPCATVALCCLPSLHVSVDSCNNMNASDIWNTMGLTLLASVGHYIGLCRIRRIIPTLTMKIDVGWGCKYIIFSWPRLSPQIIEFMMDPLSTAIMYADRLHNRWSLRNLLFVGVANDCNLEIVSFQKTFSVYILYYLK